MGLGHAGIVLGLEVSRLARSSSDWHRLLEICALTQTLILDEDGVYDAGHFNDRLLLGLKGTMSEAELHVLRARLLGGVLSKARRGELRSGLPVGLVYAPEGEVVREVASRRCCKRRWRRLEVVSMLGRFSKRSSGLTKQAKVLDMLVIEDGESEAMGTADDEVEDGPGEAETTRFAWEAADYFDPALHLPE